MCKWLLNDILFNDKKDETKTLFIKKEYFNGWSFLYFKLKIQKLVSNNNESLKTNFAWCHRYYNYYLRRYWVDKKLSWQSKIMNEYMYSG